MVNISTVTSAAPSWNFLRSSTNLPANCKNEMYNLHFNSALQPHPFCHAHQSILSKGCYPIISARVCLCMQRTYLTSWAVNTLSVTFTPAAINAFFSSRSTAFLHTHTHTHTGWPGSRHVVDMPGRDQHSHVWDDSVEGKLTVDLSILFT